MGVTAPGAHGPSLAALGLEADVAHALARYLDLLSSWSARVNLTAAGTPAERVAVLVAPVVPLGRSLEPGLLLDVGSGNGSPGLVLGLLRRDLPVTLLEPRQKRWAFLREAVRAAGRPDIEVLRARHDTYPGPRAQTVCLRALALSLDAVVGLVRPGGRVLVWGARPPEPREYSEESRLAPGVHSYRRH